MNTKKCFVAFNSTFSGRIVWFVYSLFVLIGAASAMAGATGCGFDFVSAF